MSPVVKKHKSRNQYLLTKSGYWVRDFNKTATPLDINKFTERNDWQTLMDNEMQILSMRIPEIGSDHLPSYRNAVIVSDGYGFKNAQCFLEQLPANVCIICVNRALANWRVGIDGTVERRINYYMINNPYNTSTAYLPTHSYRPRCICSLRTNAAFVKKYKGTIYYYLPASDGNIGKKISGVKPLDDYRNPVCAAISLLAKCGVRKLAFVCCDNAFADKRPAAEQLPNGLWMYPQHHITHELIDGMLYWLKDREDIDTEIVNASSGPEYRNAAYIKPEDLVSFFE